MPSGKRQIMGTRIEPSKKNGPLCSMPWSPSSSEATPPTPNRTTGPLAAGTWTQTYDEPNGPDGIPGTADYGVLLDDQVNVTLVPGGLGNADYSYQLSGSSTIGDTLYKDWDGDGIQDLLETRIAPDSGQKGVALKPFCPVVAAADRHDAPVTPGVLADTNALADLVVLRAGSAPAPTTETIPFGARR